MENPNSYRRPALPNRPWITGKLYDQYCTSNILHCDAYVFEVSALKYLVIDWREGGSRRVALDAYLIEDDGLTPVWDALRLWAAGVPVTWHAANHGAMRSVHARVIAEARKAEGLGGGRYARVVIQAHYVRAAESNTELGALNKYVERAGEPEARTPTMGELHAEPGTVGKRRGRPRKISVLPDIL